MQFSRVERTLRAIAMSGLLFGFADSIRAEESVPNPRGRPLLGDLFLRDSTLRLYSTPTQGCGVVAAYATLVQMGYPVTFPEVARQVPISASGTTMAELSRYLESQGTDVEAIETDAHGLLSVLSDDRDCHAIAWVDKNHWVAIERGESSDFLYYEYPQWHEASLADFSTRFGGRVMVVHDANARAALKVSYWLRVLPWLLTVITTAIYGCILLVLVRGFIARARLNRTATGKGGMASELSEQGCGV